jgi:hypothetical protein
MRFTPACKEMRAGRKTALTPHNDEKKNRLLVHSNGGFYGGRAGSNGN